MADYFKETLSTPEIPNKVKRPKRIGQSFLTWNLGRIEEISVLQFFWLSIARIVWLSI